MTYLQKPRCAHLQYIAECVAVYLFVPHASSRGVDAKTYPLCSFHGILICSSHTARLLLLLPILLGVPLGFLRRLVVDSAVGSRHCHICCWIVIARLDLHRACSQAPEA